MNLLRGIALTIAFLGPVQALDEAVRDAVQARRAPAVEGAARALTDIGRPAVVFGALLAIAVFDAAAGPATARLALAALLPANLAVEGLKRATFRARPDGEHRRSNAAFPSSHAANAFALALVLARRWRRLAPLLWALAAGVAASRVVLDRHWASDVLVGAALGVLAGALAVRWASGWAERRARGRAGEGAAPEPGSGMEGRAPE